MPKELAPLPRHEKISFRNDANVSVPKEKGIAFNLMEI